jgi:hypothetical protein
VRSGGVLLVLAIGCSAALNHAELLRKRASFDLECPDNDLAIQETGRNSAAVSGCGNRAAYVWDGVKNAWIASTPQKGTGVE